jgi:hypothetical protein
MIMRNAVRILLAVAIGGTLASPVSAQDLGPTVPAPYEAVEGWLKPFAGEGFAFGGNSGVFPESPDRIFILQRGETRLPDPVPPGFEGYAGSIGINTLREAERRTWQNCIYVVDGDGNVIEVWDQWDHLCADSDGPGPHRARGRGHRDTGFRRRVAGPGGPGRGGSRIMRYFISAGMLLLAGFLTGSATAQDVGPIGPSPYEVVESWHKPFAAEGFAFGGSSGVFAESPNRILISQRGETRLPDPVPPEFAGYVGSIGINALRDAELRTWQNCLMVVDGDGNVLEVWDQWDHLCADSDGPGPHRIRISPYDPQRRVWVINETRHQIFVLSNDGSELLMTLGEKNVGGSDQTHFGRPQDVAFLPDGRVLVADGLDNHRIIILDAEGNYQSEFGGFGTDPGQFNGIHALGVGPDGLIFALDRANGRVQKFRISSEASGEYHPEVDHLATWSGFGLPLDLIVNEDHLWVSDLRPLKMVKLDFDGNRLYTWNVANDGPTGFLEVHALSVDSEGNLYGGDNQHGRTQKLVPKTDADPALLVGPPFVAR